MATAPQPQPDHLYEALAARDPRFDGLFFVGVTTTGIYCRPVCAARTPGRDRCRFFRAAVEAERAGFRACFRCRPELAPGGAPVDAVSRLVTSALGRVEAGFLNDHSVAALAAELGVTDRHLRRAVEDEVGVPLVAIAQSRRLAMARRLVMDTGMPLTRIALASGFGSLRRFNALFAARFGRAPSALRPGRPGQTTAARRATGGGSGDGRTGRRGTSGGPLRRRAAATADAASTEIVVRLPFRPPYRWEELLSFLKGRAIPGVEAVSTEDYRRTVRAGEAVGTVRVSLERGGGSLRAAVSPSLVGQLMHVVARLRALFDLDARPDLILARLGQDPLLGPAVRQSPGRRLPGAFDPFEATVRAVLGQQVSVRAATTLAGRLVARFGAPLGDDDAAFRPESAAVTASGAPPLTHVFPRPGELAALSVDDLAAIGLPGARAATLREVAALFDAPELARDWAAGDRAEVTRRLTAIRGIGDWTAEYVAMRGLHDPDAFPAGDLGLRRALGNPSAREAAARAESWRPWRSYAVMHLWASLATAPATTTTESAKGAGT